METVNIKSNDELDDSLNPIFLFSSTDKQLLIDISTSKIDAKELAIKELKNRGYDENGKYVGF
jgi:hypothetical protein